jgi:hypothetical protein
MSDQMSGQKLNFKFMKSLRNYSLECRSCH